MPHQHHYCQGRKYYRWMGKEDPNINFTGKCIPFFKIIAKIDILSNVNDKIHHFPNLFTIYLFTSIQFYKISFLKNE